MLVYILSFEYNNTFTINHSLEYRHVYQSIRYVEVICYSYIQNIDLYLTQFSHA